MPPDADPAQRGLTPREVGRLLRISPDRVRTLIASGELGAINTAPTRCGRPRYIVLPAHLEAFVRDRAAATTPKTIRRRKRTHLIDYYP